jgi:hypothetical protein
MLYNASSHWIQLNVSAARYQVLITTDRCALKPSLPQRAGPAISFIHVSNISPSYALHESTEINSFRRFDQKMKMIRHQNVSVNLAMTFDFGVSKTFQEETIVIVGKKSCSTIVSALNNVVGIGGNRDSRQPRHRINSALPNFARNYR